MLADAFIIATSRVDRRVSDWFARFLILVSVPYLSLGIVSLVSVSYFSLALVVENIRADKHIHATEKLLTCDLESINLRVFI